MSISEMHQQISPEAWILETTLLIIGKLVIGCSVLFRGLFDGLKRYDQMDILPVDSKNSRIPGSSLIMTLSSPVPDLGCVANSSSFADSRFFRAVSTGPKTRDRSLDLFVFSVLERKPFAMSPTQYDGMFRFQSIDGHALNHVEGREPTMRTYGGFFIFSWLVRNPGRRLNSTFFNIRQALISLALTSPKHSIS